MSAQYAFEWIVTEGVRVCVLMNPAWDDPSGGGIVNPCGDDTKWVWPPWGTDFFTAFSFNNVTENDRFWVGIYELDASSYPPLLHQFWWQPEKGSTGVRITYDVSADNLTTKSVGVGLARKATNWWVYLIVIGVVLLLGGAGAFFFFMRRGGRPRPVR